ncbi:MAG: hypothetical protein AAGM21_02415 [Pseudomonadota bacterium]
MKDTGHPPHPVRSHDRLGDTIALAVVVVILGALAASVLTFRDHYEIGGHQWNTGDWLINADVVHVRRGLFGSGVLRISDALGISPVLGVVALQSILCAIVALGACFAILRGPARRLIALLVLSPGFTLIFLAGDPSGAARKEILTFAAMSILLFTNGKRQRDIPVVTGATVLFAIGVTGHIANAMMTPMYLFMAWTALGRPDLRRGFGVVCALMCLWAAFNTWYPIYFSDIENWQLVCEPLVARGLDPQVCQRAVFVTGERAADAVVFVAKHAYGDGDGLWHLIIYPALVVPILYLVGRTDGLADIKWPFILSFLPILPLYTVGFDWGRQTVMHITPMILLSVLMLSRGQIRQQKPVSLIAAGVIALSGLIWVPRHTFGIEWGKPLQIVLSALGVI